VKILEELLEPDKAVFVAALLLHLCNTSELAQRGVAGFVRSQARGGFFLDSSLEVLAHLLGHLGFQAATTKKTGEAGAELSERGHDEAGA
jgi:hypothetical protein